MRQKQGKNARKGQGPLDTYKEEIQSVVEFWTQQLDITVAEKQRLLQQALKEQQQRQALQQEQQQLQLQLAETDEQKQQLQAALLQMQKEQIELKQLLDSMQQEVGHIRGMVAQDGAVSSLPDVAVGSVLPLTPAASAAAPVADTTTAADTTDWPTAESTSAAAAGDSGNASGDHVEPVVAFPLQHEQQSAVAVAMPLFRQDSEDSVEAVKAAATAAMAAADEAVARVLRSLAAGNASSTTQQQQFEAQRNEPQHAQQQQQLLQEPVSSAAAAERLYPPASRVSGGGGTTAQAASAAPAQLSLAAAAVAAPASAATTAYQAPAAEPAGLYVQPHALRHVAVRVAMSTAGAGIPQRSSPRAAVVVAGGSPRWVVSTPRGSPHARSASLYQVQSGSDEEEGFVMTAAQRMREMHAGTSSSIAAARRESSNGGSPSRHHATHQLASECRLSHAAEADMGVTTAAAAFGRPATAPVSTSRFEPGAVISSNGLVSAEFGQQQAPQPHSQLVDTIQQQPQQVVQQAQAAAQQVQQQAQQHRQQQQHESLQQAQEQQAAAPECSTTFSSAVELVEQQAGILLQQGPRQQHRLQQQQQQWLQQANNLLLPPMPHLLSSLQQQPSLWDPLQPHWQPHVPWLGMQQPVMAWGHPQHQLLQPQQLMPHWGLLPTISQQLQMPQLQPQMMQQQLSMTPVSPVLQQASNQQEVRQQATPHLQEQQQQQHVVQQHQAQPQHQSPHLKQQQRPCTLPDADNKVTELLSQSTAAVYAPAAAGVYMPLPSAAVMPTAAPTLSPWPQQQQEHRSQPLAPAEQEPAAPGMYLGSLASSRSSVSHALDGLCVASKSLDTVAEGLHSAGVVSEAVQPACSSYDYPAPVAAAKPPIAVSMAQIATQSPVPAPATLPTAPLAPVSAPGQPASVSVAANGGPDRLASSSSTSSVDGSSRNSSFDGRQSLQELLATTQQQLAEVEACLAAQEALLADKHMTPAAALAAAAAEAARRRPVLMTPAAAAGNLLQPAAAAAGRYVPTAAVADAMQQSTAAQQRGAMGVAFGVHSAPAGAPLAATTAVNLTHQHHQLQAAVPSSHGVVAGTAKASVVVPAQAAEPSGASIDSPPAAGTRRVAAAAPDTPEPRDKRAEVCIPSPALTAAATAPVRHLAQQPTAAEPLAIAQPVVRLQTVVPAECKTHLPATVATRQNSELAASNCSTEVQQHTISGPGVDRPPSRSSNLPISPRSPRVSSSGSSLAAVAGWMAATVLLQQHEDGDEQVVCDHDSRYFDQQQQQQQVQGQGYRPAVQPNLLSAEHQHPHRVVSEPRVAAQRFDSVDDACGSPRSVASSASLAPRGSNSSSSGGGGRLLHQQHLLRHQQLDWQQQQWGNGASTVSPQCVQAVEGVCSCSACLQQQQQKQKPVGRRSRQPSSSGGFGSLSGPQCGSTSTTSDMTAAKQVNGPLPVLGLTSAHRGCGDTTSATAAVRCPHTRTAQQQTSPSDRCNSQQASCQHIPSHHGQQQPQQQEQQVDGALPLSPVDSPGGTPQPGSPCAAGQQHLPQPVTQASLTRAKQSWGDFLQATGLTAGDDGEQQHHHHHYHQQQQQQQQGGWERQQGAWGQQQQQHEGHQEQQHQPCQQLPQQPPYKQHWLLADHHHEQESVLCQPRDVYNRQRTPQLQQLGQHQQKTGSGPWLNNNSTLQHHCQSAYATMHGPGSSSSIYGGRAGHRDDHSSDSTVPHSMYRPPSAYSGQGPAAAMVGMLGGSSSLRVAGAGGTLGTFLAIIRRVMMLVCPNSWQWLLLVAASMVWGLKKLFGRGSRSRRSSSSNIGYSPVGGGGAGVATAPAIGVPFGIANDVIRSRSNSPARFRP